MGIVTCHMHIARVNGRKFFHSRCIRWSYRNRGYEARIHKKVQVRNKVLIIKLNVDISGLEVSSNAPRKIIEVRAFIIMILVYSAIKNRAKGPAAYSTLNPDTSSDSPSVRSKGARFVSARVEINHIMANGHVGKISHMCSWVCINVRSVKEPLYINTDRRIIASVTSYEIVWATARRAPINEYLEFDAQPDHRMEYTAKLEVASIKISPMFILISGWGMGRGIHMVNARVNASVGAMVNRLMDEYDGRSGSLINSFIASANGWRVP